MTETNSKISAKIVADSLNPFGDRLTTMVVTFPRIILAEFNTHRMFSRNSASSRAIPFEKMVKSVEENPFIPIAWQKDHKGMQGTEYFTEPLELQALKTHWLASRDHAIDLAKSMSDFGVTKQLCNRLLEPFMWHTVIVTATEWENFFALRCPQYEFDEAVFRSKKDIATYIGNVEIGEVEENIVNFKEKGVNRYTAVNKGQAEIHMMALAEAMWDTYNQSTPKELKAGEWHIPFGDDITPESMGEYFKSRAKEGKEEVADLLAYPLADALASIFPEKWEKLKVRIATARCARVSYTVVGEEGKPDNYENDIKLHDRLAASGHWSPFEHCAKSMTISEKSGNIIGIIDEGFSGNFRGFVQYRKTFRNENITKKLGTL